MNENEGQAVAPSGEQGEAVELSPAEKLEGQPATGPLPPGVESPASEEIQQEKSPNTE
ncbi:MAG TPA: hypothetical protein VEQ42_07150 [Pyrinomonadaceae bacterium]|nr:hypothetical protein [Pyrinomonadaceae bacterium]